MFLKILVVQKFSFKLLKNASFDKDGQLGVIQASPLTDERKKYLFTKIRQHVEDPFKDILLIYYYCNNKNGVCRSIIIFVQIWYLLHNPPFFIKHIWSNIFTNHSLHIIV